MAPQTIPRGGTAAGGGGRGPAPPQGRGRRPKSPRGGAGGACWGRPPASHLRCAEEPPLRRDPPGPHRPHSAPPGPRSARPAPLRHTLPDLTSLPPTLGPRRPRPFSLGSGGGRRAPGRSFGGGAARCTPGRVVFSHLPARGMPGAVAPHGTWRPFRAAARGTLGSAVRRGSRHLVALARRGRGAEHPSALRRSCQHSPLPSTHPSRLPQPPSGQLGSLGRGRSLASLREGIMEHCENTPVHKVAFLPRARGFLRLYIRKWDII